MWLLERCRKEWGDEAPSDYGVLLADAMKATAFQSIINPDDEMFANPADMQAAIKQYCAETGQHVPKAMPRYAAAYSTVWRCVTVRCSAILKKCRCSR